MTESSAVEVRDLQKIYRDGMLGGKGVHALRGVTLTVGRGEIFGLLGPNGAGKTTLIKALLGIVRHTSGQATLLGRPAGSRLSRKQVGYLPENHRIPRHHTGYSTLDFFGSLSGMPLAEIHRRRDGLLKVVGLDGWGKSPIKKYSKGMLQRLGLAQAMLHEPELLILDEPTDGVDPVGRTEMRALLQGLRADGKTIFINSHLLQELELVCDRVAILDRGRVLYLGKITDLTQREDAEAQLQVGASEASVRAALVGLPLGHIRPLADTQCEVHLKTAEQAVIDRAIDALRKHGISLISLSRGRQTLEQAFLDILERARRTS